MLSAPKHYLSQEPVVQKLHDKDCGRLAKPRFWPFTALVISTLIVFGAPVELRILVQEGPEANWLKEVLGYILLRMPVC